MFKALKDLFTGRQEIESTNKFTPVTVIDASFRTFGVPKARNELNYADAASNIGWVYIANRAIAETAAMLPLKIYKKGPKGEPVEVTSGFQYDLFNKPNEFVTPMELRQSMFGSYGYSGNCYLEIDIENGRVWNLKPQDMAVVADLQKFISAYVYRPNNINPVIMDPSTICHIKTFNPLSHFYGLSPLQAVWSQVNYLDKDDLFWETFWKEGGRLYGIFTSDGTLSETTVNRLKEQLKQGYGGVKKMQANMVVDGGLKFQQLSVSQKDAQLLEQSKATVHMILAAYKVPPSMVGILERANYSNMEVQERMYYNQAILPMLRLFEQALSGHPVLSAGGTLWYEFDLDDIDILKPDEKLLADTASVLVGSGVWTVNEARDYFWQRPALADGNVLKPLTTAQANPFNLHIEAPVQKQIEPKEMPVFQTPAIPKKARKSRYTKEARDQVGKSFDQELLKDEKIFVNLFKNVFRKQKEIVLQNIRRQLKDFGRSILQKSQEDDLLNGVVQFTPEIINALVEGHGAVIDKYGNRALDYLKSQLPVDYQGNDPQWNFSDPRVTKFITHRSVKMAGEINDETLRMAREELSFLFSEGGDLTEVADGMSTFFDGLEGWRAMRIARTETAAGANEAIESTWQMNNDIVEGKEWVTARDDRVRDSHDIDGQVVALDEFFILGDGEEADYPLAPGVSAGNVVNCRCTTVPVLNINDDSSSSEG